jgi:hypothetical protein
MLRTRIPGQIIQSSSIFPISFATGSGIVSSSAQILAALPSGLVSSSTQVDYNSIQNQPISIPSASIADVALFVLQNTFTGSFTGSFVGDGSNLIFETVNTNKNTDSLLVIGNIYNNYSNKQTTVFRNGDVVVSGSVTVSDTGVLLLTPRDTPNTHVSGALFYSSSGELYLGS